MNTVLTTDLFEVIRKEVGCPYISDYRRGNYRRCAIAAMSRQDLASYPISVLEDMADYLFDETVSFLDHKAASVYFSDHE